MTELSALSPEVRDVLMKHVRRRLTPQPIKLRADIEITCFVYEGVEAIREALKAGLQFSTLALPLQVSKQLCDRERPCSHHSCSDLSDSRTRFCFTVW